MSNTTSTERDKYIEGIQVGNIVAFNLVVEPGATRMLSGMVEALQHPLKGQTNAPAETTITIRTKNGSIFYVSPQAIVWVKTGSRWPTGIYNALKY